MQLDHLITFFDASPTIRLIRTDHAPFVLDFLHQTFKVGGNLSIGQHDLRTRLLIYIEGLHETMPDKLAGPADRYLTSWSDAGWLCRFLQASSSEPQYQLTRHAEDALQFVDLMLSRRSGLLGTESRLRMVIDTLTDLVRGASDDPERRLAYLREQKDAIEREIEALGSGKPVKVYNPIQVRERFRVAVDMLKALQADFRAVEERFHEIAHVVHAEQQRAVGSRGEILSGALDAEDLLKTQDEGISFYAFIAFLFSPDGQQALRETIDEVVRLDPLQHQRDSIQHVRGMLPALLQDADKVLQTTGRLSKTLRKLLDTQAEERRKQVAEVLRDIKQLASSIRDRPPSEDTLLQVQSPSGIASPFARSFWQAPQIFDSSQPEETVIDLQRANHVGGLLASLQRLDFEKLRKNIAALSGNGEPVTLRDLVDAYPPTGGVLELVSYFQIAHEDGHTINRDLIDEIVIEDKESQTRTRVRVPNMSFQSVVDIHDQHAEPSKKERVNHKPR